MVFAPRFAVHVRFSISANSYFCILSRTSTCSTFHYTGTSVFMTKHNSWLNQCQNPINKLDLKTWLCTREKCFFHPNRRFKLLHFIKLTILQKNELPNNTLVYFVFLRINIWTTFCKNDLSSSIKKTTRIKKKKRKKCQKSEMLRMRVVTKCWQL